MRTFVFAIALVSFSPTVLADGGSYQNCLEAGKGEAACQRFLEAVEQASWRDCSQPEDLDPIKGKCRDLLMNQPERE